MGSPFFCQREQEIDARGAGGAKPEPFDLDIEAIAAGASPLEGEQAAAAEVNEAASALRVGALADHRTFWWQCSLRLAGFR